VTSITTSRAKATAKEAPEKYKWNWLAAVNRDKALNASRTTQQSIEIVLMVGDIFIPLRPGCGHEPKAKEYTDWAVEERACRPSRRRGSAALRSIQLTPWHIRQLAPVMADVRDFMSDNQMVLGVRHRLHVEANHAGAFAVRSHGPCVRIGQRDLMLGPSATARSIA